MLRVSRGSGGVLKLAGGFRGTKLSFQGCLEDSTKSSRGVNGMCSDLSRFYFLKKGSFFFVIIYIDFIILSSIQILKSLKL